MNILFISHTFNLSAGPTWSIPARIAAQENIDNVLWVSLSSANHEHWRQLKAYHNISEFEKVSLDALPSPFNRPDMVMFEGFYGGLKEVKFARECWKYKIPYIIVPRGSLTYQAMHNKSRWKKEFAHFIFYDRFVKKASAVQFLTYQEYEDSKYRFGGAHFILPNGFNTPPMTKLEFSEKQIKGIFIGRIDIHHKGLDILLSAIDDIKEQLRATNFSLDLYGPCRQDYDKVDQIIKNKGIEDLVKLKGETLGDAKQQALLNSDVFFLTSRFEGHPMGLIEALAYGLPCLVTSGCNMRPEIEEYNAGWASDISIEGVKKSLLRMISEYDMIEKLSANAKTLATNYQWDNLAQSLHKQIKNL